MGKLAWYPDTLWSFKRIPGPLSAESEPNPTIQGLENCLEMLLKQMRQINLNLRGQRFAPWTMHLPRCLELCIPYHCLPPDLSAEVVKMLIPNSAASKIIGTKGCHAREMAQKIGCRTSISRRNEGWMSNDVSYIRS